MTTTATAESTATAEKSTKTSSTIALIFDSSKKQNSQRGLVRNSQVTEANFSSLLTIAPPPSTNPGGGELAMIVNPEDKLVLKYGANLGVNRELWLACQDNPRVKIYLKANAFQVVEPMKGKEARSLSDFSIENAIEIILATVSLEDLDNFSIGETREAVMTEVTAQKTAIQDALNAKLARNS